MITITGCPEFAVPLTDDQVNVLIALGRNHYDLGCRRACQRDGFIGASKLRSEALFDTNDDTVVILMSYVQIDTCIKILEWSASLCTAQRVLALQLQTDFEQVKNLSDKCSKAWSAVYNRTGLSMRDIDDLNRIE